MIFGSYGYISGLQPQQTVLRPYLSKRNDSDLNDPIFVVSKPNPIDLCQIRVNLSRSPETPSGQPRGLDGLFG